MTAMGECGPDQVRPLYGRFGWAYDLVVTRPAGGSAQQVVDTLVSLGVGAGSLVLDAGCGTGRYSEALAAHGFRVIGIDRSEALIEQARARVADAVFTCADLLRWRPPELADAVLCRGVLNDLTDDVDRRAAFAALSSWLRPGGVLLADVREWAATADRYASEQQYERSVGRKGRALRFSSRTTLEPRRRLMHVHEHYVGSVDDVDVDERYEFAMRCWTAGEVRDHIASAGFTSLELRPDVEAGIAPDRLLVVAHR